MNKRKKIIFVLIFLGFILCTIGISISSSEVSASNDITNLQFKRINSLYVPATYYNEYSKAVSAGKSTADKYNSVQSFTHTDKYYVFMLTNTSRDSDGLSGTNMLYIMCKKNGQWQHCKSVRGLSYGHGNDMAYNPNDNTIAVSFKDYKTKKGTVAFLDANTFKEKSRVQVPYYFGSIAYDRSLKRYYLGRGAGAENKFYYTVCEEKISTATCKKNAFSSERRMTGQGAGAHNGYFYKINYDAGHTTSYQSGTPLGYRGGEIDVYDKNYKHIRRIIFNSKQQGFNNIGEIEGVDFVGDTPYFIFNQNTIGDNTMARIYTPIYTARNVNATVSTKVKTTNNTAFNKLNLKANFQSSSPKTNKSIAFASNGYSLSKISIKTPGSYVFNIKQGTTSSSNWKLDTSTKKATVNVKYSLSVNNLIYTTSFSKGDNTFNNQYVYSAITVPISVGAKVSKKDSSYKTPTLKATIYKDGKKIETVSAANGKYTFSKVKVSAKGTYTYTIKQENSGTNKDGIFTNTIDSSTITVTVTVTEGETKLASKVKYSKDSFSNKVTATFNEVDNNVNVKIKTTKSDSSVPIPVTQATLTKDSTTISTVNSNNNSYSFNVKVNAPGAYKYTIKQNTSITGQGIYSYNLDKSSINVTIVASIDGNKLVSKSTISKTTFTNKVTANYEEINIPISTKINTIKSVETIPTPTTKAIITKNNNTISVNNEGEYYNYTDKVNKPGTYTYTIKQKDISDTTDYVYDIDDKVITYTAVVSSANGSLSCTLTSDDDSFTNTVSLNDNVLNLTLAVLIDTELSKGISTPTTQATLSQNDITLQTVNSSKSKYTFKNIVIESPGTYTYKIRQTQVGTINSGKYTYNYDGNEITVTIVATEVNDKLTSNITYSTNKFNNSVQYNYDEISIPITTTIENDITDESIVPGPTSASIYLDDTKISTVNSSNYEYNFNVTVSSPGTYVYEIKQDNAGIHKTNDYNYSIDTDTKTCVVTVTAKENVLNYRIYYLYSDSTFENTYTKTFEAISAPVSIDIITNKNKESLSTPTTTAVLSEDDNDIEEITSSNNKYTFTDLEFLVPGTYVYTIKQKNSGSTEDDKYKYNIDDRIVTVEIKVYAENSKLKYEIDYSEDSFVNDVSINYTPINIPLEANIVETKPDNLTTSTIALISNDKQVLEKVESNNSKYQANKITVSDEGTYTFKIRQKKPYRRKRNGIARNLDSKTVTATVTVTAVNDLLNYSISYDNNTFNNTYTETNDTNDEYAEVPVVIEIFSNSRGVSDIDTQATIYENGIPIDTVNQENGSYSFEDLSLEPGTHDFSIRQLESTNSEWEIDDEELNLTVTVNDDLTYSVQFRDDISTFTNLDTNSVDTTVEDQNNNSSNPANQDEIVSVPNTARGLNVILILFGIISLISGIGIMYYNAKIEKGMSV